jgi:hypothetical protein
MTALLEYLEFPPPFKYPAIRGHTAAPVGGEDALQEREMLMSDICLHEFIISNIYSFEKNYYFPKKL